MKAFQCTKMIASLTGVLAVLAMGSAAMAAPITVPNFSFESPSVGGGAGPFDLLTWNTTGIPGLIGTSISNPSDGVQATFLGTGDGAANVFQDIGALLPSTIYTLTVDIVSRKDEDFAGTTGAIQLINGTNSSGTLLVSSVPLNQLVHNAAFQTYSVNFTTGATVSGDLTINLAKFSGGVQFLFDNVRLDARPVPEPASLGMMLVGFGCLLRIRRK